MNVSVFKIFTKLLSEGGREMGKIKWILSVSIKTIGILNVETLEKNYYSYIHTGMYDIVKL